MKKPRSGVDILLTSLFFACVGIAVLSARPDHAFAQAPSAPKQPARPTAPTVPPVQKPKAPAGAPVASATPAASQAPTAAPSQKPPAAGGWIAKCVSESRQSPLECSMEQTVFFTNTGQLVASVLVRVPSETHQPVMVIQVPVGLYLPAGLNLQIDEGKPQPVPLQTCDPKGCYAGMQISPELMTALKAGKRLTMTFQNMAKNNVAVPLALDNFAEAYQKIQ